MRPKTASSLPSGKYEIPLVIQDRIFNPDGSLHYPARGNTPVHPIWNAHFFGDTPVVNGKAWPFLEVEPRRYRLRLLNGSQARYYNFRFETAAGPLPFQMIGSDGGLLPKPVELSSLLLSPAERADIVIDFSGLAENAVLTLKNDAAAPFPEGGAVAIGEIMQIRVNQPLTGSDETAPARQLSLPAMAALTPTPGIPAREIVLYEIQVPASDFAGTPGPEAGGDPRTGLTDLLINGRHFSDPVEEQPRAGTTEIWQIYQCHAHEPSDPPAPGPVPGPQPAGDQQSRFLQCLVFLVDGFRSQALV